MAALIAFSPSAVRSRATSALAGIRHIPERVTVRDGLAAHGGRRPRTRLAQLAEFEGLFVDDGRADSFSGPHMIHNVYHLGEKKGGSCLGEGKVKGDLGEVDLSSGLG